MKILFAVLFLLVSFDANARIKRSECCIKKDRMERPETPKPKKKNSNFWNV
jgi:hypothetical protein